MTGAGRLVLLFVAFFRSAQKALEESEKDLAEAEAQAAVKTLNVGGAGSGSRVHPSTQGGVETSHAHGTEKELWDQLSELKAEQLTAVLEDAGAALWSDGTMLAWLHWRREFKPDSTQYSTNDAPGSQAGSRRFVPCYADIVDGVGECMDERQEEETGGGERKFRKLLTRFSEWKWRAGAVLAFYNIICVIAPVMYHLEISSWARYNVMTFLVFHSGGFFWCLKEFHAMFVKGEQTRWTGNFVETDLLLVSVVVLARQRRKDPSFPLPSLLDLMRDARCVFSENGGSFATGVNSLYPSECPHGTFTLAVHSDMYFRHATERMQKELGPLALWQVACDPKWALAVARQNRRVYDVRLALPPEPHPSRPKPLAHETLPVCLVPPPSCMIPPISGVAGSKRHSCADCS